jgi:hypothetical protein
MMYPHIAHLPPGLEARLFYAGAMTGQLSIGVAEYASPITKMTHGNNI